MDPKALLVLFAPSLGPEACVANLLTHSMDWNHGILSQHFNKEENDWICGINVGGPNGAYRLVWIFTKDGLFSVEFSYWVARRLKLRSEVQTQGEPGDPRALDWMKKI